jgi:hypothetical protein
LIDFMLSDRRNTRAAYRFLRAALRTVSDYPPSSITTDKLALYPKAIRRLQREGHLAHHGEHRTSKYLDNIIEADRGALERLIRPTRGFQTMKTAATTLKGFEIMRTIRRGHCIQREHRAIGAIRLVIQLFGLAAWAARLTRFVMPGPSYCNSAERSLSEGISKPHADIGEAAVIRTQACIGEVFDSRHDIPVCTQMQADRP